MSATWRKREREALRDVDRAGNRTIVNASGKSRVTTGHITRIVHYARIGAT
jgi:hypothetical protein